MIVTRTPVRVSFIGGGSDLPIHYLRHGGSVVSAALDKYVFVTVNRRFDNSIRVSYSQTEEVKCVEEIQHKLVRATLKKLSIDGGIEITSIADIPSNGTGLGSSSAFTVGLLHALYAYKGIYRSRDDLAKEACEVEIELCGEPIGKQDQYAAAVGGVNLFRFNSNDTVSIEPIIFPQGFQNEFQNSMLLFYTGVTRSASTILRNQIDILASSEVKTGVIREMAAMTEVFRQAIIDANLALVGELLHEAWLLKRSVSSEISNDAVDSMYIRARQAGALGGKLLGAGGGGFLIVCAPFERHNAIRNSLSEYRCLQLRLNWTGTSIIHYTPSQTEPEWATKVESKCV